MSEKFDPKKSNQKPKKKDGSEDLKQKLDPEVKRFLQLLQNLPKETQDEIFTDIESKRKEGMNNDRLLERLRELFEKYSQLSRMNEADSDKTHKPEIPKEELETREMEEVTAMDVAEFIEEAEKIRRRDNFVPKGSDKYKN